MIRKWKRTVSLILTVTMVLTLIMVPVYADTASKDIKFSTSMENVSLHGDEQIYKLVFGIYSSHGLSAASTVMSYDSDVIVPVDSDNYQDVGVNTDSDFYEPFKVLIKDGSGQPYEIAAAKSYVSTKRNAFIYDIYSSNPILGMNKDTKLFEFYFRLADGKEEEDLNVSTFRIETDKGSGSFLSMINVTEEALGTASGIIVVDKYSDGDKRYLYPFDIELDLNYLNSDKFIPLSSPSVSLEVVDNVGLKATVSDTVNTGEALAAVKKYVVIAAGKSYDVDATAKTVTIPGEELVGGQEYIATVYAVAKSGSVYGDSPVSNESDAVTAPYMPLEITINKIIGEFKVGEYFSGDITDYIEVAGGSGVYSYGANNLPDGITLSEDGLLSGTPVKVSVGGTASITVNSTDGQSENKTLAYGGTVAGDATISLEQDEISKTFRDGDFSLVDLLTYSVEGQMPTYSYNIVSGSSISVDDDGIVKIISVGTSAVEITAKLANYDDTTATVTIVISPKSIEEGDFTFTLDSVPYTGLEIKPEVTSSLTGTDYDVRYEDNINAGTAKITVTGKGNYGGEIAKEFIIEKADADITVDESLSLYFKGLDRALAPIYSDDSVSPNYSFSSQNENIVTVDSDGVVKAVSVGDTTVTVKAVDPKGNYKDATKVIPVTVIPKIDVSGAIEFSEPISISYDGYARSFKDAFNPASFSGSGSIKYKYGDEEYDSLDAVSATIKDAGSYTVTAIYEDDTRYGEKAAAFVVKKAKITITPHGKEKTYGDPDPALDYEVTAKPVNGEDIAGDLAREEGEDAGEYKILAGSITDDNNLNYEISFVEEKLLTIKPKQLAGDDLEYQGDDIKKTYDGTIGATLPEGGKIAVKQTSLAGDDQSPTLTYSVSYNSKDVASADKVTFVLNSFSANYVIPEGTTIEVGAAIEPRDMAAAAITLEDNQKPYTGEARTTVIMSVKFDEPSLTLLPDADYEILNAPSIINVGSADFKIKGIGNYSGTKEAAFEVVKADTSISITETSGGLDKKYDGTKVGDPACSASFNEGISFIHYKDDQGTMELDSAPVDAGTYYIRASLGGTSNYSGSQSNLFEYTISPFDLNVVSFEFPGEFTVAKVYDGTDSIDTISHNEITIATGVNGERLGIDLPGTGKYLSKNAGNNLVAELDIGSELKGRDGKVGNYVLGDNFPQTAQFTGATITAAIYGVTVSSVSVKMGSDLSALPKATVTGVGDETPSGNLTWYKDKIRTSPLDDEMLKQYGLGEYTFYWRFVIEDDNYTSEPKVGEVSITVVEGDPQNIEITGKPDSSPTYGDSGFKLGATVKTTNGVVVTDGGEITWASSDEAVATIDNGGNVVVVGSGQTTIEVRAGAVPGEYAEGHESFVLVVNPKILAVNLIDYKVSKIYDGNKNPGEAKGTLLLTGRIGDDDVDVSVVIPSYDDKNVDVQSIINISFSLTGNAASNYALESESLNVPCEILKKDILAISIERVEKTYDGTTGEGNSVILGFVMEERVEEDDLGIEITNYNYDDKNVENVAKAVLTFGELTGEDALNYTFSAATTIEVEAKIVPAEITGFSTSEIDEDILANHNDNIDADTLKNSSVLSLPSIVEVIYASGTESLPISWGDAAEGFNRKGGVYTYKGTVDNGLNFNAYAGTYDARLTVIPVKIVNVSGVPGALTVAKSIVKGAASHTDIGLPATVTLEYDNDDVTNGIVNSVWDTNIHTLKTLAEGVSASVEKDVTIGLLDTGFPEWATLNAALPSIDLTITNKLAIPDTDITFSAEVITYGESVVKSAAVDETKYPGYEVTYVYAGTDSTVYGPASSPPENAGTYKVTATVETPSHKGTKSADLIINKKVLSAVVISDIAGQTYTGLAIEPSYTVTGDSVSLNPDKDYDGTFTANIDAGSVTLTVVCKGNYSGTATKTFTIDKATPSISFANTNQTLTSAGGNITDVAATLNPYSAGAGVTVYYRVLKAPGSPCTVKHDAGCQSIASGNIADCNCSQNHTGHDGSCGYAGAVYEWTITVPQEAGTYKIYGKTAGDSNLNPVNASEPKAEDVSDMLTINPYIPPSTGGGGGGGGGASVLPEPEKKPPVTSGDTTTVTTAVTPETVGTSANAVISSQDIDEAIENVVTVAGSTGTKPNVTIIVDTPSEVKKVEISLPTKSVKKLIEKDSAATVTIKTKIADITFDNRALSAIVEAAKGATIVIVAEDKEKKELTEEEQALVGDNPVVDVYIMSGGQRIRDFKGGSATISIPYVLKEGEDAEGIVVWYLTEEGRLEKKECTYDAITKTASFIAEHFSKYAVAYFPFNDLKGGEWYYENTVYAYMNGLMAGTSKERFGPLDETTRAMVVTILWRLEGMPYAKPNVFKDVKENTWYIDAISWAAEKGIVSGYSSDKFGPMDTITREQMAVIINNYAAFKGCEMEGKADLVEFKDQADVSIWAGESVKWAVGNGIISGTGDRTLSPKGSAQRAQVAAILQRFIEGANF